MCNPLNVLISIFITDKFAKLAAIDPPVSTYPGEVR
jgi:hypothetical protein